MVSDASAPKSLPAAGVLLVSQELRNEQDVLAQRRQAARRSVEAPDANSQTDRTDANSRVGRAGAGSMQFGVLADDFKVLQKTKYTAAHL